MGRGPRDTTVFQEPMIRTPRVFVALPMAVSARNTWKYDLHLFDVKVSVFCLRVQSVRY